MLTKYFVGDVAFDVPSSWKVHEADSTIEIVEESRGGAMHLSFLTWAQAGTPKDTYACLLVENLASNNGLVSDGGISTSFGVSEGRAVGQFRPVVSQPETPLHWLVASVVWQDRAVRVTYCTDILSEESLTQARCIFDSIHLEEV